MTPIRPNKQGGFPDISMKEGLPFYGDISLGNWTQYKVAMFETDSDGLFVGIEGRGCYTFAHQVHWQYVSEKLKIGEADARNVADLINDQFADDAAQRQGRYEERLCQ
jgi:hypothetical protein